MTKGNNVFSLALIQKRGYISTNGLWAEEIFYDKEDIISLNLTQIVP